MVSKEDMKKYELTEKEILKLASSLGMVDKKDGCRWCSDSRETELDNIIATAAVAKVLKVQSEKLAKQTEGLNQQIMEILKTNLPCYRDLFGGKCEFTTGCDKCPDYYNVKVEITNQILSLFPLEQAEKRGRQEVVEWVDDNLLGFDPCEKRYDDWQSQKKAWGIQGGQDES